MKKQNEKEKESKAKKEEGKVSESQVDNSAETVETDVVESDLADSVDDRVAELEKSLAEMEEKYRKEKDDYLRLMAEFDTYRRRTSEDRLNLVANASAETIKGLLPVLDDFERAMEMLDKAVLNEEANAASAAAKEGTELIYNKLISYLKTKGLDIIKAKDEKFDTDWHEAVAQIPVPEEDRKGLVYDVVSTGYTLNGKVLRYAKVVVGI